MDENDLGLSATLGLRKITSEYEGLSSKLGTGDYGIIKNNLDRSNIGLGLRKLNSMRDGGYWFTILILYKLIHSLKVIIMN